MCRLSPQAPCYLAWDSLHRYGYRVLSPEVYVSGPTSMFLNANGITLHYLDWGGRGRPAVLVHATGFCAQLWGPYAERLSPWFRVTAPDMRGHGDSDKPAGPYRWLDLGADLTGFLDALDLRDALIMGHSAGGTAAVVAAAERPERVSRLALLEPTILLSRRAQTGDPGPQMAQRARRRRAVWESREQMAQAYRTRETFANWDDASFRAYVGGCTADTPDGAVELKCPPEVEAQFYENREAFDPWPYVRRVACPTLIVLGEKGVPMDSEPVKRWRALRPLDQVRSIAGGSHFAPQEKPGEVVDLLIRFV